MCVVREAKYPMKQRLCHSINPNLTRAYPSSVWFACLLFLPFSWTPNLPSLLLLGVVLIESASQLPDSLPTLQLPSQLIFARKFPLTTNRQIIQKALTKLTPTLATPLPKTPSSHSPHPVVVGPAHRGDAARSHQPCHLQQILT